MTRSAEPAADRRRLLEPLAGGLLATSFLASFVNLSSATLLRIDELTSLARILASAVAGAAVCGLLYLGLFGLGAAARLFGRRPSRPALALWSGLAVWSGLTGVTIAVLVPVWHLLEDGSLGAAGAPGERLLIGAVVWSPAILVPLLGCQALRRWKAGARLARGLGIAAPPLAAATFALIWLQMYRIEGLLSTGSLAALGGYAVAVPATLAIAYTLAKAGSALPGLLGFTLLLLAAAGFCLERCGPRRAASGEAEAAAAGSAAGPRCILLLTVDTLRADMIAPYGPAGEVTPAPALEALAGDSHVFVAARSAAPWTKPAMASMLTGLAPEVHGTGPLEARLPAAVQTAAEYLAGAGYHTAAFGRNTFLRPGFNFHQGFAEYYFYPFSDAGVLGAGLLRRLSPRRYAGEPSTRDLTDLAIAWLRQNQGRRFFLWLHYFDPHAPFQPPAAFRPAPVPGVGHSFGDSGAIRSGELVPDRAQRRGIRELYRAEIRYVSANVGRLLAALEDLDLYDPSLIVFTSDHGEEFWEHGRFEHGHSLYDEVLRVPLSFKMPFSGSTRRIRAAVSTESVTPTLVELTGGAAADRFTSPSLLAWLRPAGSAPQPPRPVFGGAVHFYEEKESVVFQDLKYIREPATGKEELFDLRADPLETRSIADTSEDLAATGRALLDRRAEAAEALRRRLGIDRGPAADLAAEQRRKLKALGYID